MHAIKSRQGWSKSDLANEFSIDRRRVDKLLEGIDAQGPKARGYPTYYIADVAKVLSNYADSTGGAELKEGQRIGLAAGEFHPDDLHTKERKEWYDGEKVRKGMLRDDKLLVPDHVHRKELADLASVIRMHLTNQADNIDAAFSVPAEVIEAIDKENFNVLHSIADSFAGDEPGPDDPEDD